MEFLRVRYNNRSFFLMVVELLPKVNNGTFTKKVIEHKENKGAL